MRGVILLLVAAAMLPGSAAALPSAALDAVGARPAAGAKIPAAVAFLDQNGRPITLGAATAGEPTLLLFADYKCGYLCGPALALTGGALKDSGLPSSRFHLVTIGIDPREGPADARMMRDMQLRGAPKIAEAAHFLSGPPAAIQAAAGALGYHFRYDAAHAQFAHDASVYILDPTGRVADVVSPFELRPERLRDAIVGAGQGRLAALIDRVHVLCYGLDPSAGLYNRPAILALRIGGILTACILALLLLSALRRARGGGSHDVAIPRRGV